MVICERVMRDERTKNVGLIDLFNQISGRLPLRQDRIHVFLSLTDGHGKQPFCLQCKAPDEKVIFEASGEVDFKDPLAVADLNIEIRGLVFVQAGNYVFEFSCGGEPLIMRRFSVVVKE
jgi:hypothetical protein